MVIIYTKNVYDKVYTQVSDLEFKPFEHTL